MNPTEKKCKCCGNRRLIYVRGALSCIRCDLMAKWPKVLSELRQTG